MSNEAHEKAIEAADLSYWGCSEDPEGERDMAKAIRAYLQASNQVLVPREPTEEMKGAWYRDLNDWFDEKIVDEWHMWNVMIDAAPKPFG